MYLRGILISSVVIAAVSGWFLTGPKPLSDDRISVIRAASADIEAGRNVFWAAGCASCHVAPGAEETDAPLLTGGQKFPSDFGTFHAPNISQDSEHGIGNWDLDQFANAVQRGISPNGQHYYPAFPYTAYANATPEDIAALFAFMKTLPPDSTPNIAHEVGFPFNIRRSVGGWKLLFFKEGWAVEGDLSPEATRGRYLSEALSHCAECHTPRNLIGGLERSAWLSGAPDPSGKGSVPNITPAKLDWSDLDIENYLTTGFTPEYDTAGGHMVSVVQNLARLPQSDRQAIVAYLNTIPPIAN